MPENKDVQCFFLRFPIGEHPAGAGRRPRAPLFAGIFGHCVIRPNDILALAANGVDTYHESCGA